MIRVFVDANVIFSAALPTPGRSRALFDLAHGRFSLLASPHAIAEAERNIDYKHPRQSEELHQLVMDLLVVPESQPGLVAWAARRGLPPQDAPILAAAVQSGADILVTGDRRHFGHLFGKTLRGTRVVSLAEAVALLTD